MLPFQHQQTRISILVSLVTCWGKLRSQRNCVPGGKGCDLCVCYHRCLPLQSPLQICLQPLSGLGAANKEGGEYVTSLTLSLSRGLRFCFTLPVLCSSPSSAPEAVDGAAVPAGAGCVWELRGCAGRGCCLPVPSRGGGKCQASLFPGALQTTGPLPGSAVPRWEVEKAALSGCRRPRHAWALPTGTTSPVLVVGY